MLIHVKTYWKNPKFTWIDFILFSCIILVLFVSRFYFLDILNAYLHPEIIDSLKIPSHIIIDYLKQPPIDGYYNFATSSVLSSYPAPLVPIIFYFESLISNQYSLIIIGNFLFLYLAWVIFAKEILVNFSRSLAIIVLVSLGISHYPDNVLRTLSEGIAAPYLIWAASSLIRFANQRTHMNLFKLVLICSLGPLIRNTLIVLFPLVVFILIFEVLRPTEGSKNKNLRLFFLLPILVAPNFLWMNQSKKLPHDSRGNVWFYLAARFVPDATSKFVYDNPSDEEQEKVNLALSKIQNKILDGSYINMDPDGYWNLYKNEVKSVEEKTQTKECPLEQHPTCIKSKYLFWLYHDSSVNYFLFRLIQPAVIEAAADEGVRIGSILTKVCKTIVFNVVKEHPISSLKIIAYSYLKAVTPDYHLFTFNNTLIRKLIGIGLFLTIIGLNIFFIYQYGKCDQLTYSYLLPIWWLGTAHLFHVGIIAAFPGYLDRYIFLTLDSAQSMALIFFIVFIFKKRSMIKTNFLKKSNQVPILA